MTITNKTGGDGWSGKKDLRFTTQSSSDSELQFLQGFQRNRNFPIALFTKNTIRCNGWRGFYCSTYRGRSFDFKIELT